MKVERDFKLVCTGGPYGDCCCSYAVELRGEWTAQVKIEYQYGNLKSTAPEKIARKKIKRVHSNGGWSLMDYWIET